MKEFCKNLVALSVWTALVRSFMQDTMRINEESLLRLRSDFFPTRRVQEQCTRATLGLNPAFRVPARASGAILGTKTGKRRRRRCGRGCGKWPETELRMVRRPEPVLGAMARKRRRRRCGMGRLEWPETAGMAGNRVAHVCCPEPSCAGSGRNSVCLGIEALKNKSVKISAVFSRMAVFWKKLCAGDT